MHKQHFAHKNKKINAMGFIYTPIFEKKTFFVMKLNETLFAWSFYSFSAIEAKGR